MPRRLTGGSLRNRYGAGTGYIWLDNLNCSGSETDIDSCAHNGWGSHDCFHSEDVSIKCIRIASTTTTATTPARVYGENNVPLSLSRFILVVVKDISTLNWLQPVRCKAETGLRE